MNAVERLAAALNRRLQQTVEGVPEGAERRAAVAKWFKDATVELGYDERTFKRWMDGDIEAGILKLDDLNSYFPGLAQEVFPTKDAIDDATLTIELRRAMLHRNVDAICDAAQTVVPLKPQGRVS